MDLQLLGMLGGSFIGGLTVAKLATSSQVSHLKDRLTDLKEKAADLLPVFPPVMS